jgi:hypothetical protein
LTSWSAGCAKYRGEVEALELLLRVLRDAERDAKERYVGPLARRIRPTCRRCFPAPISRSMNGSGSPRSPARAAPSRSSG